jgi:hypothetical protein
VGVVVIAFVFGNSAFSIAVAEALREAGINSPVEEYKSSARMDADKRMRSARSKLLDLAGTNSKIAVFFGPFHRPRLGRQSLQALQSVLVRNAISSTTLCVHFDRGIFPSASEAARLHKLFRSLVGAEIIPDEDSRFCVGIQVADAVAHSFGQIIKATLTGKEKMIEIGGPDTGYPDETEAPLGWSLLTNLRYALLTRPIYHCGCQFTPECDPVVFDPVHDDPEEFGQFQTLLGWGVQVAPEADAMLRQAVEQVLGRLWFGCIH